MRQEALEPNSSQRKDGGGAGPGENVVSTRVWVADRCLPLSASPYRAHRSEFQLPRRLGHPRFRAVFEASNPNSSSEGREGWLTWLIRQEEAPNDKIISRTASPRGLQCSKLTRITVFVQWIPMLSLLGRLVFLNGFKFVYLWGEMDPARQEACIKAFQQDPDIKIMVRAPDTCARGCALLDIQDGLLTYL